MEPEAIPLPEANGFAPNSAYTADQLREYGDARARAAVKAERNRAAQVCEAMSRSGTGSLVLAAGAIRSGTAPAQEEK